MDLETNEEPSITSSDPNERKLARRLRIKRRLENAARLELMTSSEYEEPEEESTLIDETIETSEDTLRLLFSEGTELVTNIRVASDSIEVKRRETEVEERLNRAEQLKEESIIALKKLDEISQRWSSIVQATGPLELYQHLKDQKAKCLELIKQKNDLIKSFQLELKISDEKFMKGRKTMYEELSLLTKRIDEQVLLMKKAYRIELDHIEESIDVTRNQIIEKSMKSWQTLYNQREKDEVANIQRKLDMVDTFHSELYELHREHQEKYRETRIHLENDIQILEQELEQVKALCLLNSEKLDYNYQVLKKREEENIYIKNHQKRRLNKLQDMVNTLKKKIEEKRMETEDEVKKLTKDVERYHANVLETEKKVEHMSHVNDSKFQNIWDMKSEEAQVLIDKILSVDKVIYEQILGLSWTAPTVPLPRKEDLFSYKAGISVIKTLKKKLNPETASVKSQHDSEGRKGAGIEETNPEIVAGKRRLLRHILELIADQSGFLMEEKLDELLRPYTLDEKTFVRLDNVFAAIDIRTVSDIELMMKIFRPHALCLKCNKTNNSEISLVTKDDTDEKVHMDVQQSSILQMRELEEKVSLLRMQARKEETEEQKGDDGISGFDQRREEVSRMVTVQREMSQLEKSAMELAPNDQCDLSHPLVIEKVSVLMALKNFVSLLHSDKCSSLPGMASRLERKRYTISRFLSKEDISTFWEGYKRMLPQKLSIVWNAVSMALVKYLSVLQDRHEMIIKVRKIQRQNLELKRLLAHHKRSSGKAREEFHLPFISSVPDGPVDAEDLARIAASLSI
ncbi:hypothetical protein RUM43_003650 [Polyplax serrata]|uniref:Dynein regulatory complex protein 1 n=1 Tax=Polyplax serrata TaxID=468196 RepID=A0AAN8P3H7_POLSC